MAADRLETLEERTRYEPADVEARVFARWDEAGIFHPEPEGTPDENYSIAVPPPNVTGNLHMGHALNASIQDLLMRVERMRGRRAKWIFGTDHAGIATQRVVERQLDEEGTRARRSDARRSSSACGSGARSTAGKISGSSAAGRALDYQDERFTMDDAYVRAVTRVFVHLYDKGLVYRDNYMVNWDPGLRTAISDLEVEQRTVEDTLYEIDYPLGPARARSRWRRCGRDDARRHGDRGEPVRRALLAARGRGATLPLVGRRLPIIADDTWTPSSAPAR